MAPSSSDPLYSTSACEIATSQDKRDVAAKSISFQQLERSLDLTNYIRQVEQLLAQPIKIPGTTLYPNPGPYAIQRGRPSIFSVNGIWPHDDIRQERVSRLFNFGNMKGREWVKDLLLDESDSEEEAERSYSKRDIRAILKMHKLRRKLQKNYHADQVGGQYSFFSAGFLSAQDSYPEPPSQRSRPAASTKDVPAPTSSPIPSGLSTTTLLRPIPEPDDMPEPLAVDPNCATFIPLPPLSH